MQTPLVSIIIPTYNRAHLIGETLDSVLAQTYTNWECIVVDDGSTDNTAILLAEYCTKDSRFQYHHRPSDRPKGANACRNYGFELSKGEYVNWFDDDDLMLEDFLKIKLSSFTNKINFVICSGYYVNAELKDSKLIVLNEIADLYKDYVLWKLQILTPSILFKKNYLINEKLFTYNITRGQETELFSRLFFKLPVSSYKIVNKPLFLYKQHENTKTATNKEYIKNFKESQSYITIENFKKSLELKDSELVNYCYKSLIDFYFRGIENNHNDNSKYILINLISILKNVDKRITLKLFLFGKLFLFINRGSYRVEKHFKNYKII